ncbi:MAG: substrate-binding domain-containing protein [Candidatus Acidiferrales bacterium]|jgi:D-xylose transport system substrate-binding protein
MLVPSWRLFATTLLAAASIGSLSFAQTKPKPVQRSLLKIGFSIDTLKIERWQTDVAQFQKRAQELGAKVLVEDAEGSDDVQFRQAQKLIGSGINVLVLVAHDTDKAARIVRAAKARHVPVLCYDRLVRNSDVDFYVGFDNFAVGKLQAAALTQLAPKGNYVLIGGSPVDFNAKAAREGQMAVLKPLIDRGDIKIVSDFWVTDWNPLEAYVQMGGALDSTKGDVTAVVASNDGTAGGAVQGLENYKLAGKVLVSGQDADLAAIVRIFDGTQTMTVYKPLGNAAKQAAEIAVRLARGRRVKAASSVSNGAKKVPAILLPTIAVTKENVVQTVIKDGFQNLDTIKQNLPKEKWPE